MANGLRGEVPVTVDGRVWILVMDFNALCAFEEKTGVVATDFMDAYENGKSVSVVQLRAFVWAMLQARQPEATLSDAGDLLSADPDALAKAFQAAMPPAEEGTAAPGEAPAARG